MWWILAYASGSLIPAIISHTPVDILNFYHWWTDVAGEFNYQTVAETGIDSHFLCWILILILSIVLFARSVQKTINSRQQASSNP
jgi:hypothetical protein